jgi:hypothetical protein
VKKSVGYLGRWIKFYNIRADGAGGHLSSIPLKNLPPALPFPAHTRNIYRLR